MSAATDRRQRLTALGQTCDAYSFDVAGTVAQSAHDRSPTLAGRVSFVDVETNVMVLSDAYALALVTFDPAIGDLVGVHGRWEGAALVAERADVLVLSDLPPGPPPGVDTHLSHRHSALIGSPDLVHAVRVRALAMRTLRRHLDDDGFVEIDTPVLQPSQGESTAQPFTVEPTAVEGRFWLSSSPELYLKRMLVAGFPRVYSVARCFRDEPLDDTHLPEYTNLELYVAYTDYVWMMSYLYDMVVRLCEAVTGGTTVCFLGHDIDLAARWRRLSMRSALADRFGQDLFVAGRDTLLETASGVVEDAEDMSSGGVLVSLFESEIAPTLAQPTLVVGYPKDVSVRCYDITMARQSRCDPSALERFELYIGGVEVANCFSEINDAVEQRDAFDRFVADTDRRGTRMDPIFDHALRVGMPPASGVGIGLDRLLMIMLGADRLTDVSTFVPTSEAQAG